LCAYVQYIPACIGINTRITIRAYIYIVFYSALIFVCNAYSYGTRIRRIRMIRAFIWYAACSYDTRVRRWYAYSGIQLIMICVLIAYDTSIILVSYVKIYASDTLLFEIFLIFAWEMSAMRTNLMVTCSAQNAGNRIFRGGACPRTRGLWKCYGQIFGWIRTWHVSRNSFGGI
jgi:hypothetical protein